MNFYFAPLEGITDYTYRNTFYELYGNNGIDKFYSPFISPSVNDRLKGKEIRDLKPEYNNPNINLVPQILTNRADYFIKAAQQLLDWGYEKEINLNMGCPSGTVTSKDKGAGFLRHTNLMDEFFAEIFDWRDKTRPTLELSVKTRIGYESADEFEEILSVYNRYPISELTVHPRTKVQMYNGVPDINAFAKAYDASANPLVYNGNVNTPSDFEKITENFHIDAVMIGRGLVANPNLINEINGSKPITVPQIREYMYALRSSYELRCGCNKHLLFKLKELWNFVALNFEDSHKAAKLIRKSQTISKYELALEEVLNSIPLKSR